MENLNYHHLFYFWTVCNEGGFTKAALKLRLSQSAVSEQVRNLENVLGHRLIDRTTRSFGLTESGAVALEYAEAIFGAGQELMDFMLHRPSRGIKTIRIGALGTLSRNLQARFLEPILDRKDVRFQVTIGDSKRLSRLLRDHALDVVLSTFPAAESEAGDLYTHMLTQSPLCIVTKSKAGRRQTLETVFQSERLFLPSLSLESRSDFDHFIESNGFQIEVAGEVDDVALLRLLALTGKGVVVIPKMGVTSDIQNKSLSVIHEFKNIKQKFYAITRQKKFPNPFIAELVKVVK